MPIVTLLNSPPHYNLIDLLNSDAEALILGIEWIDDNDNFPSYFFQTYALHVRNFWPLLNL